MIFTRQNYLALHLHRRLLSGTTRIVSKHDLPTEAYKPEAIESNIRYEWWDASKRFHAATSTEKPAFSMLLPPPNITGKLHLGHALACTVQDVIARRKRSMGHNVLWLPGTDHAGIATQGVVEKYLKTSENVTRHDLGREEFIREVWRWRDEHGGAIVDQLRTLGCSLDWSRQVFTLDPLHCKAVNTAFIQLFQKGLIYRKKALVNWCTALKSTVSDIEVESLVLIAPTELIVPGYDKPVKFGLMYDFAYKIFDSNEEIVVSTTMPETMMGDTAIAVHPDDKRYQHLKGKRAIHPFLNKTIPIIFENTVNMKFGTGAVKITPAHSKVDYDVSKQHLLPLVQVINEDGLMQNSGEFDNLKRYECRQLLLQKLDEMGLLKEISPHEMSLPICSRSGDIIDHLPKEQWFLKCSELNLKAAKLVKSGMIKVQPEKFVDYWLNWASDDRDWCISRQLWWGHQIPAYKCSAGKDWVWVAANDAASATEQASKFLRTSPMDISTERDTDVLDTWFSSGVYPFACLGWPDHYNSKDYKTFYPLSLMVTGHDILGFWVHRMVILGMELTGQVPFDNVLLHGIMCDSKGAKMSKSKGNVVDPIDVINGISMKQLKVKSEDMKKAGIISDDELQKALVYHKSNFSNTNGIPRCGVDALRFTLLSQDIKSHFVGFDVAMCNANKRFGNKIWQSVKYTQLAYAKLKPTDEEITREDLTYFDKWILGKLANMVEQVNVHMDAYDFHLATKAIKNLLHNEFCDVYLEATKSAFENENVINEYAHAHTLSAVLNTALRCLAPYMVYLTDEVIPKIPSFETNIIHNFRDEPRKDFDFPQFKDFEIWKDDNMEKRVEKLLSSVNLVRQLKGLYNISNNLRPTAIIKTHDNTLIDDIKVNANVFLNLTRCCGVTFDLIENKQYASGGLDSDTRLFVEILADDVDKSVLAAREKLRNKIEKLQGAVTKMEAKLTSKSYVSKTPNVTLQLEKEKLNVMKREIEDLQRLL